MPIEISDFNITEAVFHEQMVAALAKLPKLNATVRKVKEGNTVIRVYLDTGANVKESHIRNQAEFFARELKLPTLPAVYTSYQEGAIVVDIPNINRKIVPLANCLVDKSFRKKIQEEIGLPFIVGKDNDGKVICGDLTKAPHLLIAGQSGSGKSIAMRAIIDSLLTAWSIIPRRCQFVFLDPKGVEFIGYKSLDTTLAYSSNNEECAEILLSIVEMMEERYQIFQDLIHYSHASVYNIEDYNKFKCERKEYREAMPYIVIIIDELSDILLNEPTVEKSLLKLTQKARACGIHLVMATQRPSRDIISGPIRANVPTKICCKVARAIDGRVVFGDKDHEAHRLLGRGDMLYIDETRTDPVRLQGAFPNSDFLKQYQTFLEARRDMESKIIPFSAEERDLRKKIVRYFQKASYQQGKCLYG